MDDEPSYTIMADKPKQNVVQAVRDYGRKLFGFIRGRVNTDEDAEDILQDVWYQFSNTSATETIEQVSGWLFAVARNKITDRYRKSSPNLSMILVTKTKMANFILQISYLQTATILKQST
jgi:DNA-directed RNA polymerase specialized sigma24 family protein